MKYVYVVKSLQLSHGEKHKMYGNNFSLCMFLLLNRYADKISAETDTHFLPIFLSRCTAEHEVEITKAQYAGCDLFENVDYQIRIERVTVEEASKLVLEHLSNHYMDDTDTDIAAIFA